MNAFTIAVWGSPGAGKTFLSTAVAAAIARKNNDTVIIYPDAVCPVIPALFPQTIEKTFSVQDVKSLGKAATIEDPSVSDFVQQLVPVPGYKRLCAAGYAIDENRLLYPQVTEKDARKIRKVAKGLCNYLVYDCTTDIQNDAFSEEALSNADMVIRVSRGSSKDLSYFMSQYNLTGKLLPDPKKQITVLNAMHAEDPLDELQSFFGGNIVAKVPYSDSVYEAMDEYIFPREPIARNVDKVINQIAEKIIQEGKM